MNVAVSLTISEIESGIRYFVKRDNTMERKTAINFLLYSLAGVTLESDKETIVEQAAKRAFRDAASRVLSIDEEKVDKNALKNQGINILKESIIEDFPDPAKGEDYDKWHGGICTKLKTIYKDKTADGKKFTYGIAQKWVNMTLKYLAVFYCIFIQEKPDAEFCRFYSPIAEKYEQCFHAPVDRYIIQAGKKVCSKVESLPWSKWEAEEKEWNDEKDMYHSFEKELKEKLNGTDSLLDWEGRVWIEEMENKKRGK